MARRPLKRALCLRMTRSSFTESAVCCPVRVLFLLASQRSGERKLHSCHKLSRQGMPLLMTNPPSPFGQSPPWAAGRTPPLAAAAGAQAWLVSMTAASKQEAAQPLSEHYSEWLNACTLAKWMDRLISKGHTLQLTSGPPRFNGIVETTLSSKDQQLSLLSSSSF